MISRSIKDQCKNQAPKHQLVIIGIVSRGSGSKARKAKENLARKCRLPKFQGKKTPSIPNSKFTTYLCKQMDQAKVIERSEEAIE